MREPATDKVFSGSIPNLYDTYWVTLTFEPYDKIQVLSREAR